MIGSAYRNHSCKSITLMPVDGSSQFMARLLTSLGTKSVELV